MYRLNLRKESKILNALDLKTFFKPTRFRVLNDSCRCTVEWLLLCAHNFGMRTLVFAHLCLLLDKAYCCWKGGRWNLNQNENNLPFRTEVDTHKIAWHCWKLNKGPIKKQSTKTKREKVTKQKCVNFLHAESRNFFFVYVDWI